MAKARSSKAQATRNARAEYRAQALRAVGVDVPNVGPGSIRRIREGLSRDVLEASEREYRRILDEIGMTYRPPSPPANKGIRAGGRARGVRLPRRGELYISADEETLWRRLREEGRGMVRIKVAFRDWRGDRGWETKTLTQSAMNPPDITKPLPVPGQALARYGAPGGDVQMTFGAQAADGVPVVDLLALARAYASLFFALYDLWARIGRQS